MRQIIGLGDGFLLVFTLMGTSLRPVSGITQRAVLVDNTEHIIYLFLVFSSRLFKVESLDLLHTIQLQQNLVCQKCSAEMKKESNLLMFPLPMFDSDSHPVRTLVCEEGLHHTVLHPI